MTFYAAVAAILISAVAVLAYAAGRWHGARAEAFSRDLDDEFERWLAYMRVQGPILEPWRGGTSSSTSSA
jgi:hypothetical protein